MVIGITSLRLIWPVVEVAPARAAVVREATVPARVAVARAVVVPVPVAVVRVAVVRVAVAVVREVAAPVPVVALVPEEVAQVQVAALAQAADQVPSHQHCLLQQHRARQAQAVEGLPVASSGVTA